MERNDSPIDTSMAIAGHRWHKMELRAPERASISVLLHWLLWNAHIVFQRMRMQSRFAISMDAKGQCRALSFLWDLVWEIETRVTGIHRFLGSV